MLWLIGGVVLGVVLDRTIPILLRKLTEKTEKV
jgi:hypothetical protein